jgi:hypothetical protein
MTGVAAQVLLFMRAGSIGGRLRGRAKSVRDHRTGGGDIAPPDTPRIHLALASRSAIPLSPALSAAAWERNYLVRHWFPGLILVR